MTDAAISNLSIERTQLLTEIEELKSRRFESAAVNAEGTRIINELKAGLDKVNRDIAEQELEITQLELAIEDGSTLIREIERSLEQLKEGQATSEILGPLSFSFCPSCYTQLSGEGTAGVCPLCKSKIDPEADKSAISESATSLNSVQGVAHTAARPYREAGESADDARWPPASAGTPIDRILVSRPASCERCRRADRPAYPEARLHRARACRA